ncbi:VWA-like domain-containing protein [Lactobacillus sp. Sy-1]|uniref:vWA domain-containing protein n=1 Tax=Lactobacillus sp. Sy-1 TaxID=2109645 RepID=UPI001C594615|nr:VWA-like domain-containing protein [Lactobacillus sp. Sy-1]MBW1605613.1 hypothetical protein [Lactobacillus sp. Sy-1]
MQVENNLARLQSQSGVNVALIDGIISGQLIQILKADRFSGELLMQLPRHFANQFDGNIGLSWINHQISIVINPQRFKAADLTASQLDGILKQLALHVAFCHPLMYSHATALNQLACDIVVDQYLGAQSTHTLDQLNFQMGGNLAEQMGSHYYLAALKRMQASGTDSVERNAEQLINGNQNNHDDHTGWQRFSEQERTLQTGELKHIVTRAVQQTPEKQRGTVPGNVLQQIESMRAAPHIRNWRTLIRLGLGTMPIGSQESRARFNRRQAYRMELSGRISNTVRSINIFVDNSGSMGDAEISSLLNEINHFLRQLAVPVTIYSFDAQVHAKTSYRANNGNQIQFRRLGGGGTSFQAVFDYLNQHRNQLVDTLTIILTDGHGEKIINDHGFKNILWILSTPVQAFSLLGSGYPGNLVSINTVH